MFVWFFKRRTIERKAVLMLFMPDISVLDNNNTIKDKWCISYVYLPYCLMKKTSENLS